MATGSNTTHVHDIVNKCFQKEDFMSATVADGRPFQLQVSILYIVRVLVLERVHILQPDNSLQRAHTMLLMYVFLHA